MNRKAVAQNETGFYIVSVRSLNRSNRKDWQYTVIIPVSLSTAICNCGFGRYQTPKTLESCEHIIMVVVAIKILGIGAFEKYHLTNKQVKMILKYGLKNSVK